MSRTWQAYCEFGIGARLRYHFDAAAMLLYNDIVADRESEASSLAGWLCRKERIEHFSLDVVRDPGPIVTDADFNALAQVASA